LLTIARLLKAERPFGFFATVAGIFAAIGLMLAGPLLQTYWETGLVPRFPTAFLVVGLMVLSALSLASGLILNTVTQGRRELKRLSYLQLKSLGYDDESGAHPGAWDAGRGHIDTV
jgi:hypothetical protein